MTILKTWKEKLETLQGYVKSNPGIYIDMREISIPEHLRGRFYEYFDDIRNTFVMDFFNSLPVDVAVLCDNYMKSEKDVVERLNIERIDLPVDLMSFLHNPKEGMVRWLYNRLFDMIQKKISMEEFEQMAENDLMSTTWTIYRLGYMVWAAFSIILLLEPDETYSVELDDNFNPTTGELREIAFGRQFNHSTKRIPEFIIHSKKIGRYVAVKMPLAKEITGYAPPHEIPQKMMRDHTGDTSYALDNRVMFLSILNGLDNIPVYAEVHERKIKSPDVMIEFLTEQELSDNDIIGQMQHRFMIMKPKLLSGVVSMDTGPEPVLSSGREGIDLFMAGFEREKLKPVIDRMLIEN